MMTREEFRGLLEQFADALDKHDMVEHAPWIDDIMAAWDAQAAEVARLRAEVHRAAPDREPLTQENAPRARLIEFHDGDVARPTLSGNWRSAANPNVLWTTEDAVECGATVLAWRKP